MSSTRLIYFSLGWVFFGTGVVGAFLPVLPTTPFMLLALWMFSKSSDRFHHWLYHHELFGPPLQCWREHRVIPPIAKATSVTMMSISFVLMLVYTSMPWWSFALIGMLMLYGAWFILSKPSRVPDG